MLCTSILSLDNVLNGLPLLRLKRRTLVVDVLSVKVRAAEVGGKECASIRTCNIQCGLVLALSKRPGSEWPSSVVQRLRQCQCGSHCGVLTRSTPLLLPQVFPKQLLLQKLPPDFDILCTHPMFGPDSGKDSWSSLNFM